MPVRMACGPLNQDRFTVATYCLSSNWNGLPVFGLPMLAQPVTWNDGMPLCRRSGPFVPGIRSTSRPKLEPRSGPSAPSFCRVYPKLPSRSSVGPNVYVAPKPATCVRARRVAQLTAGQRVAASFAERGRIEDLRR